MFWHREEGVGPPYLVDRTVVSEDSYDGSPFAQVIRTRRVFRKNLVQLAPDDDRLLHELHAEGATDYLALPLLTRSRVVNLISFVTHDPGGFGEHDRSELARAASFLAPSLEALNLNGSLDALLETYLGGSPARRVREGANTADDMGELQGAVLFIDLTGFTDLVSQLPAKSTLRCLRQFFTATCAAIDRDRGERLKLIGDAVLAVFPVDPNDANERITCERAVRAAFETRSALLEEACSIPGVHLACSAGIAFGTFSFGNVGSDDRLDYTAIGPPVNLASRLQDLAGELGVFCLLPQELTPVRGRTHVGYGSHSLKGIADRVAVSGLH